MHIKAVVLYGSVAKGTNRPDSDIDILLFVPLRIEEARTCGEYFYEHKGQTINIVLRSIERLRKLAKEPTAFEAEVFRASVVIEESDDEVQNCIQLISSIRHTSLTVA
jgi:predicted nucleotidyltransferase